MRLKPRSIVSMLVLSLLTVMLSSSSAEARTCPHDGDVNQDGAITQADALLAILHYLRLASPPLDTCQQDRANVDAPERSPITPADALCIFRRFLGLPSCLDNAAPVANAGPAQTVAVDATVRLDGSGSADVNGDRLTFSWLLTAAPEGSTATLSDSTAVQPAFVADRPGDYVLQLIVNDGTVDSAPATVTISTVNSAPVAEAGPDQTVAVGATAQLDGRGSRDVDGDTLTYQWALLTVPEESAAALSDPTAANPTFAADRAGYYVAQLVVNDGTRDSVPDVVVISTVNSRPVAEAGAAQTVGIRETVQLDGRASHDADGAPIGYQWALIVVPEGSTATLSDAMVAQPAFVADVLGTYVAQLMVTDGTVGSTPDTVAINAVNRPPVLDPVGNHTVALGDSLTLQLTAADPDGDALTFSAEPLPANASFAASTGLFTFTPAEAQVGEMHLAFRVSDGDLSDTEAITITVQRPPPPCLPPAIAMVDPLTGPVGTVVTMTGTNLDCGTPSLAFNGVPAVISSLSPTAIQTVIPIGSQDGPFMLTTGGGTVTAPPNLTFAVALSRDFSLTVAPAEATVLQGSTAVYLVSASGTQGFAELITLSVSGLPAGVSSRFSSGTITAGQTAMLTIDAAATAALTTAVLTLTGTARVDATAVSRSVSATLTVIAGGRTALLGQFTLVDGTPLAGVQLSLAGQNTQTDAAGNFQFLDVPAGTHTLGINATPVHPQLPMYGMDVTLTAGQATRLEPFRITPPPPPERYTPIQNATQDQVITDPRYPGASFTLPAGVTIIGWDGTPKTQMAIERLNPDALPVPPPPFPTRSLYQPFFGTPMGGMPSAPIPVTLPNDLDLKPGEQAEIWYYDAAPFVGVPGAWRLAGMGTVSEDGATVVSDPGVGIQRFCGVCGIECLRERQDKQDNRRPDSPQCGKPVDLFLGQEILEKADLVLPGRMPVAIHRTCNPLDPFGGIAGFHLGFGPGWALSTEVVLQEETPSLRRLILPGNARFAFVLQGDNSFINTTERRFAGAVLTADRQGGHTLRLQDGTVRRFASGWLARATPLPLVGVGLLVEQTDTNGNRMTIERDAFGGITRLVDSVGREFTFTLDASGRITDITDPLGRTVRYGYDGAQRLETVTDAAGGVTRYTYDDTGRILTITNARGIDSVHNQIGFADDGVERVIRQEQADGGVGLFKYLFIRSPLDCFTSGSGGGSGGGCDPPPPIRVGTRVTDPRGHSTDYLLTADGLTREIIDALGQHTRFVRDARGQVVAIHDPLGRETHFEYDAAGNVTQIIDPAGNVRRFEYEPTFNRLTKLTDALENITTFAYDARGNLTSITEPLGQVTQIAYNTFGQPISITDPLGQVTTLTYDAQGNLATITDALGNTTSRTYDAVSRLIAQTDPLGRTVHFSYDALDRITEIVDALGGVTRFTYDANGNLLTVTDALGHTTTHEYDNMDRLIRRTDPVGASEAFAYDTMGNLIRHTDRKGQVTTFDYDALNRRIKASYADGTMTTFVYDAVGRLVHASDTAGGDVLHTYDVLDRLIQQTTGLGTVEYTYDALGRRAAMRVPGQTPVTYSYDSNSRLTQLTQGAHVVDFAYDALGRRTRLTLPNGVATEYSYDTASRLTELVYRNTTGVLGNLTYQLTVRPFLRRFRRNVAKPCVQR
jgi:YD repeat-containing protein